MFAAGFDENLYDKNVAWWYKNIWAWLRMFAFFKCDFLQWNLVITASDLYDRNVAWR